MSSADTHARVVRSSLLGLLAVVTLAACVADPSAPDEPDDFRHRMVMNGLGLAVTIALVSAGIWIADVMAHMRRDQDCVLSGRSGCTHVDAPMQQR